MTKKWLPYIVAGVGLALFGGCNYTPQPKETDLTEKERAKLLEKGEGMDNLEFAEMVQNYIDQKKGEKKKRRKRKPTTSLFGVDIYVKSNYGREPERDEYGLEVPRRLDYDSASSWENAKARYRNKRRIEEGRDGGADPDELERIPFEED